MTILFSRWRRSLSIYEELSRKLFFAVPSRPLVVCEVNLRTRQPGIYYNPQNGGHQQGMSIGEAELSGDSVLSMPTPSLER